MRARHPVVIIPLLVNGIRRLIHHRSHHRVVVDGIDRTELLRSWHAIGASGRAGGRDSGCPNRREEAAARNVFNALQRRGRGSGHTQGEESPEEKEQHLEEDGGHL